jgi:hypothetical protein
MRGSKLVGSLASLGLLLSVAVGCRDKAPDAPPPPGPQENFVKDTRALKGTLPAPADEIARSANAVFKRMGLANVRTIAEPRWTAVVSGQKPSGFRSPYWLRVRSSGEGSYDSYVEVEVGLMGDEAESRYIIGEISKELNLQSTAPQDPGPPPAQDTPPSGS